MHRELYDEDHDAYREAMRTFVQREVEPNVLRWEQEKDVDRGTWLTAARQGFTGMMVPEELGGPGIPDFRYRLVVCEELAKAGAGSLSAGFGVQDDIAIPYLLDLGTEEQRKRWLPKMATGEWIGAIGMTEPGVGSDLAAVRTSAVRDGDEWVINGSKTFITNGINADIVIVVCRTSDNRSKGLSLIVVETGTPGFGRGRKLEKLGLHAQDTGELFFDNCRVPYENLLGTLDGGFVHLAERLPRERLSIAVIGIAAARAAIGWTVEYVQTREAFGSSIASFQNTQFELASLQTEVDVSEAYVDKSVLALNAGELTAVDAAKAKLWVSDMQNRVIDRCLQLFGGYGYMTEYPITRAYADARVQKIYGGTNEIMKLIIARDLLGRQ